MNDIVSLTFVLLAYMVVSFFVRWQQGSWFTPSSFFILFWTCLVLFSVLMAPDFYYSPRALLFILSALLAFYLGSLLMKPSWVKTVSKDAGNLVYKYDEIRKHGFLLYILLTCVAGFVAVILLLHFYEVTASEVLSGGVARLSDQMTIDRYEGVSLPRSIMVCLAIAYSGSLIGGFVFVYGNDRFMKVLPFLPFVPVLLFTLIYTARAPFLYQVVLFLSSVMASRISKQGNDVRLFTGRLMGWGGLGLAIIAVIFLITQMSRMDTGFSKEEMLATYTHLRSWFFGNLSGFSMWFDQDTISTRPVWGSYSLGGLFEMMGVSSRKVGLYDTYMNISANDDFTNVYTVFRLLVDDYGVLSLHLLMLVAGLLSSWMYVAVIKGYRYVIPLLSAVYAFELWSFIASFFTYNTNILALIIFGIALPAYTLVYKKTLS
jgi:oligosaccharide repeat unit polymerase